MTLLQAKSMLAFFMNSAPNKCVRECSNSCNCKYFEWEYEQMVNNVSKCIEEENAEAAFVHLETYMTNIYLCGYHT